MERNRMAWNEIPERLQPLEFEAHIWRRQESSSNVEIMPVSIVVSDTGDDDMAMPEVPTDKAVMDPITTSEEEPRREHT